MKENKSFQPIPLLNNFGPIPDLVTPIQFLLSPERLFKKAVKLQSEAFSFRMGRETWIFLSGKDGLRYFGQLTMDDVDVFEFRNRMVTLDLPGASAPVNLPEVSRSTNKVVKDYFEKIGDAKFIEIFVNETRRYLNDHLQEQGTITNLHRFIMKLYTDVLGIAFLGKELSKTLPEELGEIYADIDESLSLVTLIAPGFPAKNKKAFRAKKKLVEALSAFITERKKTKTLDPHPAIINGYIDFQQEYALTDNNLVWLYNAMNWAAVHYSSVHSLWLGIEVIARPDLLVALKKEQALYKTLDLDSIKNMAVLNGATKESIRLNSIFALPRRVIKDLVFKDYFIPKGTTISISPYVEHHNPIVYPDADSFDAYRWIESSGSVAANASFIPGGLGFFGCIGMNFVINFLTTFWAVMLRDYEFELVHKPPKSKSHLLLLPPSTPVALRYRKL